MLLDTGNKVLVTHRRLFERDAARYFVGEVLDYEDGIAKVSGYSFVRDIASGELLRKEDRRIKFVSLTSAAYIVYQLPDEVEVGAVRFDGSGGGIRLLSGSEVLMNLSELPHSGRI